MMLPRCLWLGYFLALRGSEDGQVSIESGALGYTVVSVYGYSGSWRELFTVTHIGEHYTSPSSNMYNYTIDYSQLYSSPSGFTDIKPVPSGMRGRVFAFYYPWYGGLRGPTGYIRHWGEGYAHTPALGLYDSMDEKVIEAHIQMAKAAGIDGFIVSWWGVDTSEDLAFSRILKVAERLNFPITIYYESYRGSSPTEYLSVNKVVDELSTVVREYSTSTAFMKANGAPVIFIYAVGASDRSPSFWTTVRSSLEARAGPVYLVGDLLDSKYAEAFDGCHTYAALSPTQASDAYKILSDQMRLGLYGVDFNQAVRLIQLGEHLTLRERFLAYTVHPGFDHTKIGGTLYLSREDGQTYYEYWRGALSCEPDGILITSWNEWHEGSEIEPSVEYGFKYVNMTRSFVSDYDGYSPVIDSTNLKMSSTINDVLRLGSRNASILLTNESLNPAIGVYLTLSLDGGLSLHGMNRSEFYAYTEERSSNGYKVTIPLLGPGETLTFNATLSAAPGAGEFKASALGYSAYGVPSHAYIEKQVQVVSDRVVVNLSSNSSRVEVGSEAKISVTARYEYDGRPLVGDVSLNDTLTKNSTCTCTYSARSVSDRLYGLTDFATNIVTVTFDRIVATGSVFSLSPGSVAPSITLRYESDGRPVDEATVTVNGVSAVEVAQGVFQATVVTWSLLSQLSVYVVRPGFRSQDFSLSGYVIGNIAVEAVVAIIVLAIIILITKRARRTNFNVKKE